MIKLSPNLISMYYFYECPRFLIFRGLDKASKIKFKIPHEYQLQSPVTKAIMEGGYIWEEKVINTKIKDRTIHADFKDVKKIRDAALKPKETLEKIRSLKNGQFIYQGMLEVSKSFYDSFNINKEKIEFTLTKPDLIYNPLDKDDNALQIIDLKASEELKISHRIQVSIYALILKYLLIDNGIKLEVNLDQGGVWLFDQSEHENFEINQILPHLQSFFDDKLSELSSCNPHDADWHLNYRCETCEFFEYCKKESEKKHSISLYPNLSINARNFLRTLPVKINTIKQFKTFINKRNSSELLSNSAVFNGKKERIRKQIQSLLSDKVVALGSSTLAMPIYEGIRIILTFERDPISGEIYSMGFIRDGGNEIFGQKRIESIFIAKKKNQCNAIRKKFIKSLYKTLAAVDKFNENLEWSEKLSVQTYLLADYEKECFHKILVDSLLDLKTKKEAIQLMFFYQNENLRYSDDHPGTGSILSIVVIMEAIKQLFLLPIHTAFNLEQIHTLFKPSWSNFSYEAYSYFHFEYSNALKPTAIFELWYEGKTKRIDAIESEIKKRLWVKLNIISGIRERLKDNSNSSTVLFAWPPKFEFPDSDNFQNSSLSKVAFIFRYEKLLDFIETKVSRTLPLQERMSKGLSFILKPTSDGSNMFIVENDENEHTITNGFSWLFSELNGESDKAQMSLNDLYYRDKWYIKSNLPIQLVQITNHYRDRNDKLIVTIDFKKSYYPEEDKEYLLQPRFTDFLTERVNSALKKIDQSNSKILKIIDDPYSYLKKIKLPANFNKHLVNLLKKANFTSSQKDAFTHFLKNNLTVVWGPPGTGKTHFLAVTVLLFAEINRRLGKEFKICITGFTHVAIENCLNKIYELNLLLKIWENDDFNLYKIGDIKNQNYVNLLPVSIEGVADNMETYDRCIFGSTVYGMQKALKNSDIKFDAIIIDEASQLKVAEALMAISWIEEAKGRLLIVGDDKQLPPIIKGVYGEDEDEKIKLHKSIFELLKEFDINNKYTRQLYENFRMNSVLSKYPAEAIYGRKYKSFNNKIASAKSKIKSTSRKNTKIDFIVDPNYPLVLCVFEGIITGAENTHEAELVAQITKYYRRNLFDKKNNIYPQNQDGNSLFWKDGIFIVSPHHKQILRIKKELKKKGLRQPYFVDTVDKMQGQETDIVIISYGLSDQEQAMNESEFIYSLNRLNVSITRGRVKTILFISKELLNPRLEILQKNETAEGITFMLQLNKYISSEGEKKSFVIDKKDKINLELFRIGF